jgi:hypothetical protein
MQNPIYTVTILIYSKYIIFILILGKFKFAHQALLPFEQVTTIPITNLVHLVRELCSPVLTPSVGMVGIIRISGATYV